MPSIMQTDLRNFFKLLGIRPCSMHTEYQGARINIREMNLPIMIGKLFNYPLMFSLDEYCINRVIM